MVLTLGIQKVWINWEGGGRRRAEFAEKITQSWEKHEKLKINLPWVLSDTEKLEQALKVLYFNPTIINTIPRAPTVLIPCPGLSEWLTHINT